MDIWFVIGIALSLFISAMLIYAINKVSNEKGG